MPHHTPTNFEGLTQETSPSLFGSFRLSSRSDMYRPAALSAMRSVRHGVVKAPWRTTAGPLLDGASCARSSWPSTFLSHIDA
jgi:hypothetical protein